MKHNSLFRRAGAILCTAALILSLAPATLAAGSSPAVSSNINKEDYTTWSKPVTSYLYENGTGGLTRVEYTGGQVVVENYSSSFAFLDSRTIQPELPIWGGFFAGENYNFLIFGQQNTAESDSAEVIRVVKYDKNWNRLGAASLKGANTTVPFDAGSLRCDEYGGYLYIRTSHEMYTSSDGLNHQANLTMAVRQSDMTITDSFCKVMNISYGYVSHSFNQFLLVDEDGKIIALDHGDAYPRSAVLTGYYSNASTGRFSGSGYDWCWNMDLMKFAGSVGDNTTGASVGGLAETANGYAMTFNYDGAGGRGDRSVYFQYMDKATGKGRQYQITSSGGSATPVLAPTGPDGGYLLWNGKSGYTVSDTLYYLPYGSDGVPGATQTANAPLSDCQPIPYGDGVVWYVTENSVPTFYTLNASGVTAHALGEAAPEPTPTPTPTPTPSQNPQPEGTPADPRAAATVPQAVEQADALASRFDHTTDAFAAVDSSGTLWAWGTSYFMKDVFTDGMTKPVALMDHVEQVSLVETGYTGVVLAVKEDHTLWGVGTLGYLGFPKDNPEFFSAAPVKLMDNVKAVSGSSFGAMVLKQDGSLWYLGSPADGELGDGSAYSDTADCPAGTYHVMDNVKMVASGYYRFAALKTDGSVWVWGADGYAGDGKLISWLGDAPQKFTKILNNMISVGMDGENGWAIDSNGALWSWGLNEQGQVGNGGASDTTDSFTQCKAQVKPVKILDRDIISASVGMAVAKDGTCYRWGTDDWDTPVTAANSTPARSGSGLVIASDYVRDNGDLMAPLPSDCTQVVRFLSGFFQTGGSTSVSFTDVPASAWYAQYVSTAAQAGLMNGVGNGKFNPQGIMSTAEVVALTARLHAERNGKTIPTASGAWYQGAYDYCVNNGLFTKSEVPLSTMGNKATRFQMVDLMDRAVPDSEMKPVNTVPDGGVPDLRESDPYGAVVYRWYRAGITEGDQSGRFNGSSQISRSEVATLLCRLAGLTPRV